MESLNLTGSAGMYNQVYIYVPWVEFKVDLVA